VSDAGHPGPCSRGMWRATIRIPGALGVLFAIPVLVVFGLVALACLVAGLTAMMVAPWILRRRGVEAVHEEADAGDTITLDRAAYCTVNDPRQAQCTPPRLQEPTAITRWVGVAGRDPGRRGRVGDS
jgi:hypothetical protein